MDSRRSDDRIRRTRQQSGWYVRSHAEVGKVVAELKTELKEHEQKLKKIVACRTAFSLSKENRLAFGIKWSMRGRVVWVVQLAENVGTRLRFEGVRLFSRAVTPTFSMPVLAAEVHGMQSEDFFLRKLCWRMSDRARMRRLS